jgi:hypothetical protein
MVMAFRPLEIAGIPIQYNWQRMRWAGSGAYRVLR